jgi:diaminopimelate epimerase
MSDIRLPFVKLEGLGNSYIFVEAGRVKRLNMPKIAAHISKTNTGIGADGLIVIDASRSPYVIRIFNSDGSEAEMCGNGLRQAALYLKLIRHIQKSKYLLETIAGQFSVQIGSSKGKTAIIQAVIGSPDFSAKSIGLKSHIDLAFSLPFEIDGKRFEANCVSIGNPHAVIVTDNYDFDWPTIGRYIGDQSLFKNGINVHFMKVISPTRFEMRIFERGVGITQACGSGAAACLAVGVMRGLIKKSATAMMPGGNLKVTWDFNSGQIIQTGPASIICEGVYFG